MVSHGEYILVERAIHSHLMVSTYWLRIQSNGISWWVHIGWESNPLSSHGEYILFENATHSHLMMSTYWLREQSTVMSWWVHIGWESNPQSSHDEYILVENTIHCHVMVSTYWLRKQCSHLMMSTYWLRIQSSHLMVSTYWLRIQSTVISWWVHIGWEYSPPSSHGEYIFTDYRQPIIIIIDWSLSPYYTLFSPWINAHNYWHLWIQTQASNCQDELTY